MRILFQSRKTLFSSPGGDTIQILQTKKHLENLGIKIDISTDLESNLSKYDLIHIFNLMRPQETYLQVKNAKKYNKKVVLSTIYGLYTEYEKTARGGIMQKISNILSPYQIEYLKIFARGVVNREMHKGTVSVLSKGYYKCLKEILGLVDALLPNSQSEMKRIRQGFKLNTVPYFVIPNAIDPTLFNYEQVRVSEQARQFSGCILCVARIEGRKCQLDLVRAMRGLPYKLVLIGKPAPNHLRYYELIKKESSENTCFLEYVPHEQLPQYYKVAKAHALISWMETPGLSSLEAAVMKCNIVVTKKGDTDEYFGQYAYYCEPGNIKSIRNALIEVYKNPFDENLRKKILDNYTWQIAAKKTLDAYEQVLKS